MNAAQAFAKWLQWMAIWISRFKYSQIKKEIISSEYDLSFQFDGDFAETFRRYGEEFTGLEIHEKTDEKYVVPLELRSRDLFFWSWYVRRMYSFDVKSQGSLRHIDLSGIVWSDLFLPFPVVFLEFQAEFFVWGCEYDSAALIENPEEVTDGTNCAPFRIVFFSRKRAENLPSVEIFKKIWHTSQTGGKPIAVRGSDWWFSDERFRENVFLFRPYSNRATTPVDEETDRGIKMCIRALISIIRKVKISSGNSDSENKKDGGEIIPPENLFEVEKEQINEDATSCTAQEILAKATSRKSPRTHLREKHERTLKDGRVIKIPATVVNRYKEDLILTTRFNM
jgi:hypothetical protein